ncbi:MAG TPA: cobalamin-binding protein [Dehalococcoidia bacterium]|nr:cobalamin-binding protein [Dehalococcoidia bacterium]
MPTRITKIVALLALAALTLALVACGSGTSARQAASPTTAPAAAAQFPLTLTRSGGKTLTLDKAPARIVSLSPGATEIIYAIGAESQMVAVDKQADYPAAAKDFPTKLDAYEPNVESIAALKPDLVFVASDPGGLVDALDRLQIPVLWSDLNDVKTVDDVFGQITLLGKATGRTDAADALVASLRQRVDAVTSKVSDVPMGQKSVYHEVDSTYYTASDGTFIGDLYRLLHVKNIAGDAGGSPYPQLTQEAIIAANPQVIVLADEPFGTTVDSVKQRAGWQTIDAVKNNAIFAIDPDLASRAGPRIVDALEQLAKDIYPERFQ